MANLNTSTPYIKDWLLPSTGIAAANYHLSNAKADIEFLNEKLSAVTRDLSVYDFYNINAIINTQNEYNAVINNLIPGQSAIIGAESLTAASGDIYNRGDIILKLPDYTLHHIAGIRGGIFYPSKIINDNNGNYTLTFSNTTQQPAENTEQSINAINNVWEANGASATIKFIGIQSTDNKSPYNIQQVPNNNQVTFPAVGDVRPIIKCYNASKEEVYCDYAIEEPGEEEEENSIYTISNLPDCIALVVIK